MTNCKCGSLSPMKRDSAGRINCQECGSFFDALCSTPAFEYDDSYPDQRAHFNPEIGTAKVKSLQRWLHDTGLADELGALTIAEVGFGGGYCLQWLHTNSRAAYGIEVVPTALEHAQQLGLPAARLFTFAELPDRLPEPIDVWLFQDSFEHLERPGDFLQWMGANTSPRGQVVIVAPEACSLSDRLMGRFWPHRLPDHAFHWSKQGLARLCCAHGFKLESSFSPVKHVTLGMIARHFGLWRKVTKTSKLAMGMQNAVLRFNIGEMGLLLRFERDSQLKGTCDEK